MAVATVVASVAAGYSLAGGMAARADDGDDQFAGYALAVGTSQAAGTSFAVTVTAVDSDHDGDAGYVGVRCVTFSGPSPSPSPSPNGTPPNYPAAGSCRAGQSSLTFNSSGKATAQITLFDAQSTPLKITDALTSDTASSATITVAPGSAKSFKVATPSTQTAGVGFVDAITALDTWGNTATSYSGSQTLGFSGPLSSPGGAAAKMPNPTAPLYPPSVSFTSGVGSASLTLYDASTSTVLTVTQSPLAGSSGAFAVQPGSAASFQVATPSTQTAGVGFVDAITALDTWGNTATSYSGSQTLGFSGPLSSPGGTPTAPKPTAPLYPPSVSFTGGMGSASLTLYDASTSTVLTVTQSALAGSSGSFTVQPGPWAPYFSAQPSDTQVSSTIYNNPVSHAPVAVTVADAYGNDAPSGTTVTMTGPAGLQGTLPQETSGTTGVASFGDLSLGTTGTYQLVAQVGPPNTVTTTSAPFQVVIQLKVCNNVSQCEVVTSNSSQSADTTMTSAGNTTFQNVVLSTSFLTNPNECGNGFAPIPGTVGTSVEVNGTVGNVSVSQPSFSITFTVTKATLKAAHLDNLGASQFKLCLGAKRLDGGNQPWTTASRQPAVEDQATGFFWGLVGTNPLPGTPYILSQHKDGAGNLVIVLIKPWPWDGWAYV